MERERDAQNISSCKILLFFSVRCYMFKQLRKATNMIILFGFCSDIIFDAHKVSYKSVFRYCLVILLFCFFLD